jgi:hypothetical protein
MRNIYYENQPIALLYWIALKKNISFLEWYTEYYCRMDHFEFDDSSPEYIAAEFLKQYCPEIKKFFDTRIGYNLRDE